MIADLPSALVAAGVTTTYGYPGYPADEFLAAAEDLSTLDLVVTSAEPSAVAAAHAHWMVTGHPAAVVLSDGAGIEAAVGMLALAVRGGAGILVIMPGLLPGVNRSAALLEALGAVVVNFDSFDATHAAAMARAGHVVAAVPGFASTPPLPPAHAAVTAASEQPTGHQASLVGPRATEEQLRLLKSHTCPVITTPGVPVPENLRDRWLGPLALGTHPGALDLLGLGERTGGTVADFGSPSGFEQWLHSLGSDVAVTSTGEAGPCRPTEMRTDSSMDDALPTLDVLTALTGLLPAATLVSDAGACHRISTHAARRSGSALVSTLGPTTMGWGPGAALGAALARRAPVILSIGDGSLAMAGLQLLEWRRYGVAGVVVAAHNGTLGSVTARVGRGHPRVTACDLAPHRLWDLLEIPWRGIESHGAFEETVQWAANEVANGRQAALVVDTTGLEELEYRVPAGLPWWDRITRSG